MKRDLDVLEKKNKIEIEISLFKSEHNIEGNHQALDSKCNLLGCSNNFKVYADPIADSMIYWVDYDNKIYHASKDEFIKYVKMLKERIRYNVLLICPRI